MKNWIGVIVVMILLLLITLLLTNCTKEPLGSPHSGNCPTLVLTPDEDFMIQVGETFTFDASESMAAKNDILTGMYIYKQYKQYTWDTTITGYVFMDRIDTEATWNYRISLLGSAGQSDTKFISVTAYD